MTMPPTISLPLHSSTLAALRYFDDATLELDFNSGSTYRYFLVPRQLVDSLLAAESAGRYFNAHIRAKFNCMRRTPGSS